MTDYQFFATSKNGINNDVDQLNLAIFPINRLFFFNDINNLNINIKENEEDEVPGLNCSYVDIDSFKYKTKPNLFSLIHLNIASLSKHQDVLETILSMVDL